MTLFDWLRATQSAMALTALVLVLTTGHAIVTRMGERPLPGGYMMTLAVLLIFSAMLLSNGWAAAGYWLAGKDHPVVLPVGLRIVFTVLFLSGGSIFVALTQRVALGVMPTLILWASLMAAIVVMIAFIG